MKRLSPIQDQFLDLLLKSGALKFGNFKTKSGRNSPYFFNTGAFDNGKILGSVAACYAKLIQDTVTQPVHLYGPAYKGIPLAVATSMELSKNLGYDVPFTFNRKEAKDHGEGGVFVGRSLTPDKPVVIIEDVLTGGTSIRDTMNLLIPRQIKVAAIVIGIDRQERGQGLKHASLDISKTYDCPVHSILNLDDIISELWSPQGPVTRLGQVWIDDSIKKNIDDYRSEWG